MIADYYLGGREDAAEALRGSAVAQESRRHRRPLRWRSCGHPEPVEDPADECAFCDDYAEADRLNRAAASRD